MKIRTKYKVYHVPSYSDVTLSITETRNQLIEELTKDELVCLVLSVCEKQGVVVLNKEDIGLGNVDNTSDLDKPISIATQEEIDKVKLSIAGAIEEIDKRIGVNEEILGEGLNELNQRFTQSLSPDENIGSSQTPVYFEKGIAKPVSFTVPSDVAWLNSSDKTKLNGLAQSDWNATSGGAVILNKPTLGGLASKNSVGESDLDSSLKNKINGALQGSDISDWAKASTKPSYTASEVGAAESSHTHGNSDLVGLASWAKASTKPSYTAAEVGASETGHKHVKADITDFPTSMPASDVHDWAKSETKPSYSYTEVGAAASSHTHGVSEITDMPAWSKAATKPSYVASEIGAAEENHTHTKSEITDLAAWVKSDTKPTYTASEVGASATGHGHTVSDITDFPEWSKAENKPSYLASEIGGLNTLLDGKVDKVEGSSLMTAEEHTKLSGLVQTEVKGNAETAYRKGQVDITKENIGLGNVDNTSDANKPVSSATQTALDKKVDKVNGSSLVPDSKISSYDAHLNSTSNPHSVGKSDVGLGNVDNTSDLDKPISTAVLVEIDSLTRMINDCSQGISQLSEVYTKEETNETFALKSDINALKETLFYKDSEFNPLNGMPIVLYDSLEDKKVVVQCPDYNLDNYPKDRFTPIGVVVIPKSHTKVIYPEGDAAKGKDIMISLKGMNYNSPENGGNNVGIYWGGYDTDITELTNYQKAPVIANITAIEDPTIPSSYSFLPSDRFNNNECMACPGIFYKGTTNRCPSPYLYQDGKYQPNPAYYSVVNESTPSVTSDFKGRSNTEIICSKITVADWRTSTTITNSSSAGNYPAAACCARYKTIGTNSGDWYLPSMGELGYIMSFFNKLQQSLNTINGVYEAGTAIALSSSYSYWSSSESRSDYAYYVDATNGYLYYYLKSYNYYVRAFAVVNAEEKEGAKFYTKEEVDAKINAILELINQLTL